MKSSPELPGGNIRLPRGYTSILGPIVSGISESCIFKGYPVKHIHWRYRAEMEEVKNDKVVNVKKKTRFRSERKKMLNFLAIANLDRCIIYLEL